jgi:hypothetical protein
MALRLEAIGRVEWRIAFVFWVDPDREAMDVS